ncbi:MAG: nucleotidyltransferase domain-containing protein [Clostridiales bacterium]|nr:nucleotidyltransferase domain-containing protein [Clostridiales bacterium]
MLREKIVMMNQREYIEYVRKFAEAHGKHIWLGGSFLRGNPTPYSDVDISAVLDKDSLRTFIYGYGEPVYLSYTTNPEGIIIVIYEDGVAVDLEVIGSVEVEDDCFFHMERIKDRVYSRNSSVCRKVCQRNDLPYQTARLFHRSLIKYLGGKQELGVSVANEIAAFLKCGFEVAQNDYKNGITRLIDLYNDKYPLDEKYRDLCVELILEV